MALQPRRPLVFSRRWHPPVIGVDRVLRRPCMLGGYPASVTVQPDRHDAGCVGGSHSSGSNRRAGATRVAVPAYQRRRSLCGVARMPRVGSVRSGELRCVCRGKGRALPSVREMPRAGSLHPPAQQLRDWLHRRLSAERHVHTRWQVPEEQLDVCEDMQRPPGVLQGGTVHKRSVRLYRSDRPRLRFQQRLSKPR